MPLNNEQKKEIREHKEGIEKNIHRSADFQRVFGGADGERVFTEIDKFCGFKDDTFSIDPYLCAYNAGKRAVSIFIHNAIEQDVEKAKEMLKDATN